VPAGDVLDRHLLGEEIVIERLGGLGGHCGRREDEDPIVGDPHEEDDLHLAVHVEQCRGAPLPRTERLDLVAHERVQERRPVAAGELEDAEIAAVEEPDAAPHLRVLIGGSHGRHST